MSLVLSLVSQDLKRQMTGDKINVKLSSDPNEQGTRLFGDFGTTAMILSGGEREGVRETVCERDGV